MLYRVRDTYFLYYDYKLNCIEKRFLDKVNVSIPLVQSEDVVVEVVVNRYTLSIVFHSNDLITIVNYKICNH